MPITAFHVTSLAIGCGLAVVILVLVRRNHLMVSHSIWWLFVAAAGIVLGVYPRMIDRVSRILGVHYAPTLVLSVCVALVLIKMLAMEMNLAEQERKIRKLAEKLAILEGGQPDSDEFADSNGSDSGPQPVRRDPSAGSPRAKGPRKQGGNG